MSSERIPGTIPSNAWVSTMSLLSMATEDDDKFVIDSRSHYVHNKNLDLIARTIDDHLRNYVSSVSSTSSRGRATDEQENQKRNSSSFFRGGLTIQRVPRNSSTIYGQREHDNIWKITPKHQGKHQITTMKEQDPDGDTKTTECTASYEARPWELQVRVCDVAHLYQRYVEPPWATIPNKGVDSEKSTGRPGLSGTSMLSNTQKPSCEDTETKTTTPFEQYGGLTNPTVVSKKWEGYLVRMKISDPTSKQDQESFKLPKKDFRMLWYDLVGELLRKCELASLLSHKKSFSELYETNDELKSGAYCVVCRGKNKSTGEQCAIKIVARNRLSQEETVSVLTEASVLLSLRHHSNVVQLVDFFEQDQSFILVMDLCEGGDLLDRVSRRNTYTERDARDLAKTLLEVLRYCHEVQGIAHLDLKPVNLLMKESSDDSDICLADFGLACRVISPASLIRRRGTPYFIAPEVVMERPYDQQADMWSLGVIVYILLGGGVPFTGKTRLELFRSIESGKFMFPEKYWSHVSSDAKNFIQSLLVVDPKKRMTAEQALQSRWIQGADGQTLANNDLSNTSKRLRTFNARMKLKAVILGMAYFTTSAGFHWSYDHIDSLDSSNRADDSSDNLDGSENCHGKSASKRRIDSSIDCVKDAHSMRNSVDTITAEQKEEYREIFSLFDKNEDGAITIKELLTVFHLLGVNATEKNAASMLETIDTNRNGSIDFNEFLGFLGMMTSDMQNQDDERRMRRAFEIFDEDHDGYISRIELRDVMTGLGAMLSDTEIDDMIYEADTNRDGLVSYAEFKQFVMDELPLTSSSVANEKSEAEHDEHSARFESTHTYSQADAVLPSGRITIQEAGALGTDQHVDKSDAKEALCSNCGAKTSRLIDNGQCIQCCSEQKDKVANDASDKGGSPVRLRKRDMAKRVIHRNSERIKKLSDKGKSLFRESCEMEEPEQKKAQRNDSVEALSSLLDGLYTQKNALRFHQTAKISSAGVDVPHLAGSIRTILNAYGLDLPDLEEELASDLHEYLGHHAASQTFLSKNYIDGQTTLQAVVLGVNVQNRDTKTQQCVVEIVGEIFELQAHDETAWLRLEALGDQTPQSFLQVLRAHFSHDACDPPRIREQEGIDPKEIICRKFPIQLDKTIQADEVKEDGLFVTIVNSDNGEYIAFDVQASDTVLDVKGKVFELKDIPTDIQDLFYNHMKLQDDKNLSDYGVFLEQNSEPLFEPELELRTRGSDGAVEIVVNPVTEDLFRVEADRNDSIFQVKMIIEGLKGIPPSDQHLILGDVELDNSRSVSSYGIKDESLLSLTLRIRGSADSGLIPALRRTVHDDTDHSFPIGGKFVEKDGKFIERTFKTNKVTVCLQKVARLINLALCASGLALPSLEYFFSFLEACADQEDSSFGTENEKILVGETWIYLERSTKTFRALEFVMKKRASGKFLDIGATSRIELKVCCNAYYLQAYDEEAFSVLDWVTSIAPPDCFRNLRAHFRLVDIRMQAPAVAGGTDSAEATANPGQLVPVNPLQYDPRIAQTLPAEMHVPVGPKAKARMISTSSPKQMQVRTTYQSPNSFYCSQQRNHPFSSKGSVPAYDYLSPGIPALTTQSSDTGITSGDIHRWVENEKCRSESYFSPGSPGFVAGEEEMEVEMTGAVPTSSLQKKINPLPLTHGAAAALESSKRTCYDLRVAVEEEEAFTPVMAVEHAGRVSPNEAARSPDAVVEGTKRVCRESDSPNRYAIRYEEESTLEAIKDVAGVEGGLKDVLSFSKKNQSERLGEKCTLDAAAFRAAAERLEDKGYYELHHSSQYDQSVPAIEKQILVDEDPASHRHCWKVHCLFDTLLIPVSEPETVSDLKHVGYITVANKDGDSTGCSGGTPDSSGGTTDDSGDATNGKTGSGHSTWNRIVRSFGDGGNNKLLLVRYSYTNSGQCSDTIFVRNERTDHKEKDVMKIENIDLKSATIGDLKREIKSRWHACVPDQDLCLLREDSTDLSLDEDKLGDYDVSDGDTLLLRQKRLIGLLDVGQQEELEDWETKTSAEHRVRLPLHVVECEGQKNGQNLFVDDSCPDNFRPEVMINLSPYYSPAGGNRTQSVLEIKVCTLTFGVQRKGDNRFGMNNKSSRRGFFVDKLQLSLQLPGGIKPTSISSPVYMIDPNTYGRKRISGVALNARPEVADRQVDESAMATTHTPLHWWIRGNKTPLAWEFNRQTWNAPGLCGGHTLYDVMDPREIIDFKFHGYSGHNKWLELKEIPEVTTTYADPIQEDDTFLTATWVLRRNQDPFHDPENERITIKERQARATFTLKLIMGLCEIEIMALPGRIGKSYEVVKRYREVVIDQDVHFVNFPTVPPEPTTPPTPNPTLPPSPPAAVNTLMDMIRCRCWNEVATNVLQIDKSECERLIFFACRMGPSTAAVRSFLQVDDEISAKLNKNNELPLHVLCCFGAEKEAIESLVRLNPKSMTVQSDVSSETPLGLAQTREWIYHKHEQSRVILFLRRKSYAEHFDSMTGLPRRPGFDDWAHLQPPGWKNVNTVLLYIDIASFTTVNNKAGHNEGDRILKKYARDMWKCCEDHAKTAQAEVYTPYEVYRMGGDEFAVVCKFIGEPKHMWENGLQRLAVSLSQLNEEDRRIPRRYSTFPRIGCAAGSASNIVRIMEKADELQAEVRGRIGLDGSTCVSLAEIREQGKSNISEFCILEDTHVRHPASPTLVTTSHRLVTPPMGDGR